MCILFLHVADTPQSGAYQVVLANNRDEYYARPTKPAARWTDDRHCISGLDQEPGREGGTWLGISEQGKVGVLLNVLQSCDPSKDKKGRGALVTDFLRCTNTAHEYTAPLAEHRNQYNPFHLLLIEKILKKWTVHYFGSHDNSSPCTLATGVSAWGNSHREKPWNKVQNGKTMFHDIIKRHASVADRDVLVDQLLALLNDKTQYFPDPVLGATAEGYLSEQVVKERSSICVQSKPIKYGTRTNTLVLIDSEGHGEYIERTMQEPIDQDNPVWKTQCIPFNVKETL